MFKNLNVRRPLALAMAALMLAGCAGYSPDIPDRPASAPRPANPMQSRGDMIYTGPIDQETHTLHLPADGQYKVNALGEPQFVTLDNAMASYGEHSVRKSLARTAGLCYKVEIQRWALAEAEAQAAWVQDAQAKTHRAIKNGEVVSDVLSVGSVGTGFAVAPGDWLYGVLNLFSAAQGANSNHMWSLAMDQTDRLNDLNITLVHLFLGNEDLYLDSMQVWCPVFEGWMSRHASFGPDGNPQYQSVNPWQQQPAGTQNAPAPTATRRHRYHN